MKRKFKQCLFYDIAFKMYNWNIVESGVKHHKPNHTVEMMTYIYIRVLWYCGNSIKMMAAKIDWNSMWIHRIIEPAVP